MWACVLYVHESLKFDGEAMVVVVPLQYFNLGTVIILVCSKALGISSSLAVKREVVYVGV